MTTPHTEQPAEGTDDPDTTTEPSNPDTTGASIEKVSTTTQDD